MDYSGVRDTRPAVHFPRRPREAVGFYEFPSGSWGASGVVCGVFGDLSLIHI